MLSRFALSLVLAGACLAQDAVRMDQLVQSYVDRKFMGTALVARGNQVLFSKGYGFADLEWDIPNAPSTKFRLGSVTKQFTAASILLLEERGKLNVNDPVKKYMPDAPAAWDKMTLFHVLTHTAGIPNFTGFPDYEKLSPFPATPAELVARFRDKPLDFQPGEKWNYSNSGFVLLGYLIEKISGETYEKFVQENIFTPLGMKDSGYDSNSAIIRRRASGYALAQGAYVNDGFIHMSIPHAAGALYSTTEDLLKWEQGLFGGKLLKPASLEKMTTPFKNNYAFGLGVETVGGHKLISHGGGIQGFNTELDYYPEDKLTVVVLENVRGAVPPAEIARKLGSLAHGENLTLQNERKPITLDAQALARYQGAYEMAPGVAMLIRLDGDQLTSRLPGQGSIPIFPQSDTMFFLKVVDAQIEFPKEAGKPSQLTLHQNGRDRVARRMDEAEFEKLAATAASDAKRFKDQTPAPGSEAALRKMIEDILDGKPDYDRMSSGLAQATRQQLSGLQSSFQALGKMQSIHFKAVGPGGADIFTVQFEKGGLEYRIWLAADGKVESANVHPVQ